MRATLPVLLCASLATFALPAAPAPQHSKQPAAKQSAPATPAPPRPAPKPADPNRLPPLPDEGFAPPRPMADVRAAYLFAALRPDVMQYVPCFCGCERSGHKDNEDCFVASRAADGSVTWSPHGLGCAICIDVARDAARMSNSGASVSAIRKAIEARYASSSHGSITPTPQPPAPKGPAAP